MDCDDQPNKFSNGLHLDSDNSEGSNSDRNVPGAMEKINSSPSEANEKKKEDDDEEVATSEKPASRSHKYEFRTNKFCFDYKALSSHRGFQLQAPWKRKEAKASNNNDKDNCNEKVDSSYGKQRCSLCKRDFPSNKSLCGHMRFHSKREWRGVHPPPPLTRAVAAPNKPITLNVSNYLQPSWHKTDKRGRKRTYNNEAVNAAQILMQMSRDNWSRDNLNLNGNGKGSSSLVNVDSEKEAPPSPGGVQDGDEKAVTMKKDNNKRLKIMVKLKNLYSASNYQCGVYGKSFAKFQAYGGHMSSHYREKNNNKPHETAESSGQSVGSTTIWDFDLNELPSDVLEETS